MTAVRHLGAVIDRFGALASGPAVFVATVAVVTAAAADRL